MLAVRNFDRATVRLLGDHVSVEILGVGRGASVAMDLVKLALTPLVKELVERVRPLMASLRDLIPLPAIFDVCDSVTGPQKSSLARVD